MALLMPVSALLAGGSKSAIAPCVETSVPENAVRVSRLLAWTGNFLNTEDGALLAGLLRVKQDLPGIHTLFPSSPLGTNYRTITIHSCKMLLRRVHFTHMKMLLSEGSHADRRRHDAR